MILCEKPLAMNVAEGEEMVAAVEKAGVPNMVWFNYRRVPAISLAKQLVDEGRIGRPFHYRAQFLQDWTIAADVPQGGAALWRLDVEVAGSGVTGDLLAHSIDTAMWLNGPIAKRHWPTPRRSSRSACTPRPARSSRSPSTTPACSLPLRQRLDGHVREHPLRPRPQELNTFELNGENGSVYFDLEEPQWLDFFEYRSGDRREDRATRRLAADPRHQRRAPLHEALVGAGLQIGYEHTFVHAVADFLRGLETGVPAQPDFRSALQTQKVCEAVLRSASVGTLGADGGGSLRHDAARMG